MKGGDFRKFDYGLRNEEIYGTPDPPKYKLKKPSVPTKIWYGTNDYLVSEVDSKRLISEIGLTDTEAILTDYNHLDFLWVKSQNYF